MKKIVKILYKLLTPVIYKVSMKYCTKFQYHCLKFLGTVFSGEPRYISAKVWIDGSFYNLITLGRGVTISSNVRILTHDWALDTIFQGLYGYRLPQPMGKILPVSIGEYSFIGTGSIIMPGAIIGKCCIIGAGSVVRGNVPDYSMVIGNPSIILSKKTNDYLRKNYAYND